MSEDSTSTNKFTHRTADWRGQIRINKRRTRYVIVSFVLLYLLLGLFLDTLFLDGSDYPSFSAAFLGLVTLQSFPYITCITTAIALISLFVTFLFHDRLMLLGTEYREITPETALHPEETQLYNIVEEMKVAAGLQYMPKVYLIDAPFMNAFASGYSEKSAMVAITKGLMDKLDRDELQAVMAHELSHIRHLDIKLTLMASILSNIMIIMIDFLFRGMLFSGRGSRGKNGNKILIFVMILRFVLPLITILLMLYLSRTREYMADAGSVQLTRTNEPMARALLKIQQDYQTNQETYSKVENIPNESSRRQAYIFDPRQAGLSVSHSLNDIFSTHPSIEKRLGALGFKQK